VGDGLDVVAIGVSHETSEVVGVVFGEGSRCVEDLGIDTHGGGVEASDGGPIGSGECNVKFSGSTAVNSWPDPEWGTLVVGEANRLAVGVGGLESERREDDLVEGSTTGDIGDLK
jgi:hypothetical protein